jgi:beta-lactamase regulating signal transducer with metallopeptidase domain
MNDLGLTLAWSAVQVSLVLLPAAALHILASRRSPTSGAWVAAVSLGLVVVFSLLTHVPGREASAPTAARVIASKPIERMGRRDAVAGKPRSPGGDGPGWSFTAVWSVWVLFEKTAAAPATRCRHWGSALAAVALAGTGVGLLRLIVGMWAVHRYRRQSRPVSDPCLNGLVEELRLSLGCHRRVELRETPEFTTPATAGWRRAVVFLPDDWRSWDGDERRAVVAHELAHVCRDDYVTGLVAQLALALYFYHPLVHWLASRLRLGQELAADALGARLAGGRALYLRSLSRLALRQDGRSPCWPARAFLPAKGSLIRRIAMLRDETKSWDRPWSGPRRTLAALVLLSVAAGVSLLHGPARGEDNDAPAVEVEGVKSSARGDSKDRIEPFDLSYIRDDTMGVIGLRPAAAYQRAGIGRLGAKLNAAVRDGIAVMATDFGFGNEESYKHPLSIEQIEQITFGVTITRLEGPPPNRRIQPLSAMVRMTEPFDWVKQLRAWKYDLTEVRDRGLIYYSWKCPNPKYRAAAYCPDDRTIVFDQEENLVEAIRRKSPAGPWFAQGEDWDRVSRGLFAFALSNRDGRWTQTFKGSRAEERGVPLVEHAERWVVGLPEQDDILFQAVATCVDTGSTESTARATEVLLDLIRPNAADPKAPRGSETEDVSARMVGEFFTKTHVERQGRSVVVHSAGLGTLADFVSRVVASGAR